MEGEAHLRDEPSIGLEQRQLLPKEKEAGTTWEETSPLPAQCCGFCTKEKKASRPLVDKSSMTF